MTGLGNLDNWIRKPGELDWETWITGVGNLENWIRKPGELN